MRRQLLGNVWRVGWWSGPLRGVNALGAVLALLGFLAVSLGLAAGLLANAFYEHRAEVSRARSPVVAGDPAAAALRWQQLDGGVGDRIVTVVALEPLTDDAPLPPGVARWPAPGEAVLSPELARLLATRGAADRYGEVAGRIDRAGLAARTELLAYTRPPVPLAADRAIPVTGFGASPPLVFGEVAYDRSVTEFWAMALVLTVVPGVIALAASSRVADERTRRRHVLLVRLGADRSARALLALPRILPPCLLSLAATTTLVGLASTVDLAVPVKGNVLDAAVVRSAAPALLAALVAAHGVGTMAVAALVASRQGDVGGSRLVAPPDRPAPVRVALLLIVLAAQPWVVATVDDRAVVTLSTMGAAVVVVLCLPAALAAGLRALSGWRGQRDLAAGEVGRFLGRRITGRRSAAIARLTAAVGALVVVVGHAATVLVMFSGPAVEARRTTGLLGNSLLVGRSPLGDEDDVVAFAREHGLAVVTVTVRSPESGAQGRSSDRLVLTGTCSDLDALDVPCRDGRVPVDPANPRLTAVVAWHGGRGDATAQVGAPGAMPDRVVRDGEPYVQYSRQVLIDPGGGDLDPLGLARDGWRRGRVIELGQLGAGALLGAVDLLDKSYWVFVFGAPGVLTLVVVAALVWAAVTLEETAALLRDPLLVERHDVLSGVAAVRIALPVAAGGLAGAAATAWLLAPHVRTGAIPFPWAFLAWVGTCSLATAALSWLAGRRLMAAAARERWDGGEGPRGR